MSKAVVVVGPQNPAVRVQVEIVKQAQAEVALMDLAMSIQEVLALVLHSHLLQTFLLI
jgi:hypothetical protein